MRNALNLIATIAGFAALTGCDKYKDVQAETRVTGFTKLHDTLRGKFPVAAPGKLVYLNQGTDVSSYILQTNTDSSDYFSFNYIQNRTSTAYVRYTSNGTEFFGQKIITSTNKDSVLQISVYPTFYNAISIQFNDTNKRPISNLAFRLYTSSVYAAVDFSKHAYLSGTTTGAGLYTQYNVPANMYYIVANDNVGGKAIKTLDSLNVKSKGIFRLTTTVK
ncbi:hypothetical protein [Mucilaginibacter sp. 3215]|uniref:hypothetical protein n=1 Tax=Mucilaginibacter sp. 3215 TaxID=3373912 RepID=UPI003D1C5AA5